MSSSSILPGGNGSSGGISDVVSQDDLTRWAQIAGVLRYLTAPLDPAPPPTAPTSIAAQTMVSVFTNAYAGLTSAGVDNAIAHKYAAEDANVAGHIGTWTAEIIQWCMLHAGTVLKLILAVLDGIREGADPQVGQLAVMVLNEFLGTEFNQTNLPMGIGTGDHIQRATAIGKLLYEQLESEFAPAGGGPLVPSSAAAETFSGLAVNFGLASGIMGLIGGMVPIGHINELRELGEEVARNVGLGRLVRRALTPLVTTLVSNPAQWAINVKYRPTQFKEADLVNPFLGTHLDHTQLYNAMHLLGYTDDKIEAFIKMHQKRLSVGDIALLVRTKNWTEQDATNYVSSLGYPRELAGTVLQVEALRREEAWVAKLIDELETEVKNGRLTRDEFENVLGGLPLLDVEKGFITSIVDYKVKARVSHQGHKLSGGELFYAFAAGLVTETELRDRWTALGLPSADQDVRMSLWLLHLNRLHELTDEKQKAFQQKVLAFQEKQGGAKHVLTPPIPPVPPFPL